MNMNTSSTLPDETVSLTVRRDELATILAGLRLYQFHTQEEVGSILSDIATDGGAFDAIESDQVDELVERLNCGGPETDQSPSDSIEEHVQPLPNRTEANNTPNEAAGEPYLVEQYELYVSAYKVIATSAADAIVKLLEDDSVFIEGMNEYIEPCDALGMPVEENEELAKELRERGVFVGEDVIPTIRCIQRLTDE